MLTVLFYCTSTIYYLELATDKSTEIKTPFWHDITVIVYILQP